MKDQRKFRFEDTKRPSIAELLAEESRSAKLKAAVKTGLLGSAICIAYVGTIALLMSPAFDLA